jgi:phosphoribosyl 1,2-cyclic phosphodiesterase
MRVRIWGCRGSLPTPGASTVRYGGNTSCVEVRLDDDSVLVLDAGSSSPSAASAGSISF